VDLLLYGEKMTMLMRAMRAVAAVQEGTMTTGTDSNDMILWWLNAEGWLDLQAREIKTIICK